jgi:MoxR-like ATPase
MKPSRVNEVLSSILDTRWPAFLWGAPGVGKSSVVRQIAQTKGLELIDIRAPLLDPTDLRGLPYFKDGVAVWAPPSFLPSGPDSAGVLFFDELNAAPPLVQASLYQLTLDRRVGEYVLPQGWKIIAAGNRTEDAAVVFRMPSALANRFVHIDFETDFEDWITWALTAKIHPLVQAFLRLRRDLLLDTRSMDRGFPTPRSWEMASDAVKVFGDAGKTLDVLIGIVGEGAAMEFVGFCSRSLTEERVNAILSDPERAALPTDLGDLYALLAYVAARAKEDDVLSAAGRLLVRLNPELAILLTRQVLLVRPNFSAKPSFARFIEKHRALLRD